MPSSSNPLRSLRALIVEDQPDNLFLTERILNKLGCQTEACTDGRTALARMQAAPFDLVLLDCGLPALNGVEVVQRYRATEPAGHHTLIIATTARATPDTGRACLAAGMDSFAPKPLRLERLRDLIMHSGIVPAESRPWFHAHGNDASPPAQPADLATFHFMADGDLSRMAALAKAFLAGLVRDATVLQEAITAGDSAATHHHGHRILSQTALVAAGRLTALAARIQGAAGRGDTAKPREIWPEFARELDKLAVSLRARTAPGGFS